MQFSFRNQSSWKHGTLQLRACSGLDLQPVSGLDLQPVFRHFTQQRLPVKALQHTPRIGKAGYTCSFFFISEKEQLIRRFYTKTKLHLICSLVLEINPVGNMERFSCVLVPV